MSRTPGPPAPPPRLRQGIAGSDFLPHEVAIALALAFAIELGAAGAIRVAGLHAAAVAPDIDPGLGVPIQVKPVVDLDSPLLKLGGKKVKYKLPDQWIRQAPVVRRERKAYVSSQAEDSTEAIPPDEVEVADAGTEPPELDAALAQQVDVEVTDSDAGPSNVDTEGSPDGVPEGTETDPLKARAVSLYRARLISWFSSRFRVGGSGLSQEELTRYRVGATVHISADRVVQSYDIVPSGNAAFDAAARQTLAGTVGQQLPPPPENYPDAVQNQISLTFVCRVNTCD